MKSSYHIHRYSTYLYETTYVLPRKLLALHFSFFDVHHDWIISSIMGRKRNQGKARKAAKAKAQQEAEERGNNQTIQERLSPLAAQVQRCQHGISVPETDISFRFIIAFCKSFLAARGDNLSIMDCLEAAENDTTNEFLPTCGAILPKWRWRYHACCVRERKRF